MKVTAYNVYSIKPENARVVCGTDHETADVRAALDEAEGMARAWNAKETRADMLVTMLTCRGFVRAIPTQRHLFAQ